MRIGIDLDNILNNLNTEWLSVYNKDHNDNLTLEDIQSWNIEDYVKNGKEIYDYLNCELLATLKPLPNSIEVTRRLSKDHELFIVTASKPEEMTSKWEWIKKYFPHIPPINIIVCQKKDIIDVDVLIDDAPHNIKNFPNHSIVLDYPWNRGIRQSHLRAYDWLEIEKIVKNIDRKLYEERYRSIQEAPAVISQSSMQIKRVSESKEDLNSALLNDILKRLGKVENSIKDLDRTSEDVYRDIYGHGL